MTVEEKTPKGEYKAPSSDRQGIPACGPRHFSATEDDPRKELRDAVDSIFSDRFMVFVSLLMVPIVLLPFAMELSAEAIAFIDICDWVIIAIFVAEYASKLYLAKDRRAFFSSGWHLLDLAIIILPFAQYLQLFGVGVSGSPSLLLRLLRLPRALAVGGRTLGSRMRTHEMATAVQEAPGEVVIRAVEGDLSKVREGLTWEEVMAYYADPKQEWIDVSNAGEDSLLEVSRILKIPSPHFQSRLIEDGYPHIDYLDKASLVFLQSGQVEYPEHGDHFLTISRTGVLIVCSGSGIITVSKRRTDLFDKALESVRRRPVNGALVVSALYGILEQMVAEYREVVSEIELEVLWMEGIPRSQIPKNFLERTFQLNKEVSRLGSNTLHLKEILGTIAMKKVQLEGFDEKAKESFDVLGDEAAYLDETVQHLKENLISIIDLYINRTSFETNKILKVLAVITALGIIPAIIGGLLGENLLDTPYAAYLWQIVLLTGIGMGLVFYIFVKLGWLKT